MDCEGNPMKCGWCDREVEPGQKAFQTWVNANLEHVHLDCARRIVTSAIEERIGHTSRPPYFLGVVGRRA